MEIQTHKHMSCYTHVLFINFGCMVLNYLLNGSDFLVFSVEKLERYFSLCLKFLV